MTRRRLHIAAPAGPCRSFFENKGIGSFAGMLELIRTAVGDEFDITAEQDLFVAEEEETSVGRRDDHDRAADLENALADDATAAIITIRGGAWLARVLPRIDFERLRRRTSPVAVFGFSEITSLVNIVAAYPNGRGIYDNSPAFLVYGMRHYAQSRASEGELQGLVPRTWMQSRLVDEFRSHFSDLVSMIRGHGSRRRITARLLRGEAPSAPTAGFIGGNLTVFPMLLASAFREQISTGNRWIVLEDYNDKVSRLDRLLGYLTLAGAWERCAGVLLGDFHLELDDLTGAVADCLAYHLPDGWCKPVLVTRDVGHTYPMSPLPLQVPMTWIDQGDGIYELNWQAAALKTV